ncbi:MAG: signal peptidase II [Candidatus Rariloculaceae bacterium]
MSNPISRLLSAGTRSWLLLALLIVVLDQWAKQLITQRFAEFESVVVLPFLDLMRLHNTGAAFSFLSTASGWQRWFFVALAVGVTIGILIWLWRLPHQGKNILAAGLCCVMGGAVGNVIDRIFLGHVVDFIRVHYGAWYFPAFNVADSAITVGAALLILDSLLQPKSAD